MSSTGRPLRIGIAGIGFGAAIHLPALRACPGVEVAGLCASTQARAAAAASRLGVPVGAGGVDALLALDLDAVTLALPPAVTGPAARAVLRAGLPLLCEKPVAATAIEAAALVPLAAGRPAMVDFQFAELATFQRLKDLLEAGSLGEVEQASVSWIALSRAQENRLWSWKTDAARGGGVLNLLGAHALFVGEWLFGPARPVAATLTDAATRTFTPEGASPAEDGTAVDMTLASGASLSIRLSNALPGEPVHRWEVRGSRSKAVLENMGTDYMGSFTLTVDGEMVARESPQSGDGRLLAFHSLARRFIEAAASNRPASPSIADGYRVQALIDEIRALAS